MDNRKTGCDTLIIKSATHLSMLRYLAALPAMNLIFCAILEYWLISKFLVPLFLLFTYYWIDKHFERIYGEAYVLLSGVMSDRSGCIKYIRNHQLVIWCYQHVLTVVSVTSVFFLTEGISKINTLWGCRVRLSGWSCISHKQKRIFPVMLKPGRF